MRYDDEGDAEFRWLFVLIPIALGLVFVFGFVIFPPTPLPALKNEYAFGCYTSTSAPSIILNDKGFHVLQSGFPTIPFHLERHKTGIAISADRPIQATRSDEKYTYSFYSPGIGYFLDFFHVVNGKRYGVFDESDLAQFTMLARDGYYLTYSRSADNECAQ